MNTPLVSIIIPNYNHESYLRERLDSVFNQSFENYEVILLDDASTDDSLKILELYKDHPKVSHFIINEKNSGSPFKQWVKGIQLARGEYIWIAESDDFAENNFLKETVSRLERNKESNLVYVDSRIVDSQGKEIEFWSTRKNKRFKTARWSNDYEESGKSEVIDFLLYSTTINNASAVLFRKESLVNSGNLEELSSFRTAGDLFIYMNVVFNGKLSYISEPLNNYREHLSNVTKTNTKSGLLYFERINCFEKSLKLFDKNELSTREYDRLIKSYIHILRKNGFSLVDFGFEKNLNCFIENLVQKEILSKKNGKLYQALFMAYALKSKVVKKLAKKLIKRIL